MSGKITRGPRAFSFVASYLGLFTAVVSAPRLAAAAASDPVVTADAHPPGIPLLSSDPGAAYTIYLDFGGFSYTGTWSGSTPGVTPAYDTNGDPTTFTSGEQDNIRNVWAQVAQKYAGFNVNVTTVDPSVAAGQASSDAARQAYYDSTSQMMHTVIGGSGAWSGGGGVSFIGVDKNSYSTAGVNSGAGPGFHTNWVFAGLLPTSLQFVSGAAAHENGHGFGLNHQSDFTGTSLVNEYSTNNGASGPNSYAPIMGATYPTGGSPGVVQRGTWRVGNSDSGGGVLATQNDVKTIVGNPGMNGFVDDAVGHNHITATPLALVGSAVDPNLARGWITPVSAANPNPIGANNYTTDFFSFASDGVDPISLTVNDGTEFLNIGTADPGATLKSTLQILNGTGTLVVGTGVLSADTLSESFAGVLPTGTYYAQVSSFGGNISTFDASASYYDMGAFFITGAVPEPAAVMLLIPLAGMLVRRRGA
jgi:hypothetical protein